MVDRQIIDEWIGKADEDLTFAKITLEEGLEFYLQICFYLHQATEKILKAYILANELGFEKIHDLNKLLRICLQKDKGFDNFFEAAKLLNPFYIGTRYPDFVITINRTQAENALEVAEAIADFVKQKIGKQPADGQAKEEPAPSETEEAVEGEVVEDPATGSGQGKKE